METSNQTKRCPFCDEIIQANAIKCKHCHEFIDKAESKNDNSNQTTIVIQNNSPKWNAGVAALLSFFIPGVGQMYKGNVISGIMWLIFTSIGYTLFIIPGLILHLICIIAATTGDPYK